MNKEKTQVEILKAMAHPIRLEILKILNKGALCAGKTNELLSISQPNFSQHLKILREAGLIERVCRGTRHCYYISMPDLIDSTLEMLEKSEHIKRTTDEVIQEVQERCNDE